MNEATLAQKGLVLDQQHSEKTLEIIHGPQPARTLTVLEAWKDANDIVHYIKVIREDGKVTWEEVGGASIFIVTKIGKWLPTLAKIIGRWFKRRG